VGSAGDPCVVGDDASLGIADRLIPFQRDLPGDGFNDAEDGAASRCIVAVAAYDLLNIIGANLINEPAGLAFRSCLSYKNLRGVQGDGLYQPFAGADSGRWPPAWPAEPDYAQLVDGGQISAQEQAPHVLESSFDEWGGLGQLVLEQGRDFDMCVLAIPVGALPPVTRALTDPSSPQHDPRWRAMTTGISLIQTVSAQLWFDRDVDGLFDPPSDRGLLTGFAQPQSSLGQLGHLIATERWGANPPRTVIYHTGALAAGVRPPDQRSQMLGYAEKQRREWREQFELWLATNYREVFPRGPKAYEDLLALLRVPDGVQAPTPADRLAQQWFSIGCNPSDFYVLSLPGQMRLRMAPHESGVRFMMLAGDWTKTDLNCGCVEAATQSGMLAARALSGDPVYVWRTGF